MLRSLSVRNFAVLAGGEVTLGEGLNVLSGETGAGKSLIVDSLALLTGARASTDLVRDGAEALQVTGIFDLDGNVARLLAEAGIDAVDRELVVRREIGREGRNRVFVNDQPATARLLQQLAPHLLRIHGQREELGLADPELQRRWLDRSGGAEAPPLLAAVRERFEEYRELAGRLERLSGDDRLRRERVDLLRFQAHEIDAAGLTPGEELELRRERDVARHAEAITESLASAWSLLVDGEGAASDQVAASRHQIARVAGWEPVAAEVENELAEAAERIAEAGRMVSRRLSQIEVVPGRLDEIESRLALLERLFRRYAEDSVAVLELRRKIGLELEELDGDDDRRSELEVACGRSLEDYRQAALALSLRRREWGKRLARRLAGELEELALRGARVEVGLSATPAGESPLLVEGAPVEFGADGFDRVVFEFAANAGEPLLPLSRVASGGELARVSLGLQLATLGDQAAAGPSLVFDEIDAGLGGAEGAAVGRKLSRLGRGGQVLVVTHLAQVASFGDHHHRVSKREQGGRTFASVEELDEESRVEEIARMLSADRLTATSRQRAAELLAEAREAPGP